MLYYHMLLFCCWLVENPVQVVIDDLSASAGVHRVGSSAQGFHSRFWCRNIVELKPFCCFSCSVKQPVYQWAIVQDKAPFDDKIAAGPESRRPGFCLCRESATRSWVWIGLDQRGVRHDCAVTWMEGAIQKEKSITSLRWAGHWILSYSPSELEY